MNTKSAMRKKLTAAVLAIAISGALPILPVQVSAEGEGALIEGFVHSFDTGAEAGTAYTATENLMTYTTVTNRKGETKNRRNTANYQFEYNGGGVVANSLEANAFDNTTLSIHIYPTVTPSSTIDKNGLIFKPVKDIAKNGDVDMQAEAGQTYVIETDFAFDSAAAEGDYIHMRGQLYSSEPGSYNQSNYADIFRIYKSGNIRIMDDTGNRYSASLTAGRWHRLRIELACGEASDFSLYIDDSPIVFHRALSMTQNGEKYTAFYGLATSVLRYITTADAGVKDHGVWFDNISHRIINSCPVSVSANDARLDGGVNYPDYIYVPAGAVCGDIERAYTVTNGSYTIVNAAGEALSAEDSLEGAYMKVSSYACADTLVPFVSKSTRIEYDVETNEIPYATSGEAVSNKWYMWNYSTADGGASYSSDADGFAGKAVGDKAFTATVTDVYSASENGALLYQLQGTGDTVNQDLAYYPATLEWSMYFSGQDSSNITVQLKLDGSTEKLILALDTGSTTYAKYENGSYVSGGLENGVKALANKGWNRVAVTTYPGHDYVSLYINGKHFADPKVGLTYRYVSRLRINDSRATGSSLDPKKINHTVGFDDFRFYNGFYTEQEAPSVTPIKEPAKAFANSRYLTVTAGGGVTLDEILDTGRFDFAGLFPDPACASEKDSSLLEDGDVLVLRQGLYFKSYAIVDQPYIYYADRTLFQGEEDMGTAVDLAQPPAGETVTYKMTGVSDKTGKGFAVIIALYDGNGALSDVSTAALQPGETSVRASLAIPETIPDGAYLKTFTFENFTSILPVDGILKMKQ